MAKTPLKIMSVRVEPEIHRSLERCAFVLGVKPLTLAAQYVREGVAKDLSAENFLDQEEQTRARLTRDSLKELSARKVKKDPWTVVYDENFDYSSLQRKG